MFRRAAFFLFLLINVYPLAHSQQRTKLIFDEPWNLHLGNASDYAESFNYRIYSFYFKNIDEENTIISKPLITFKYFINRLGGFTETLKVADNRNQY